MKSFLSFIVVAVTCLLAVNAHAALVLTNGGFDVDGSTGFTTSISNWTRTAGNGGWQSGSPWGAVPAPTSSPNVGLLNAGTNSFTGTEFTSDVLGGTIDPGTQYELAFDVAVREQGQFGGAANTIAALGTYDVDIQIVGSVDGVLASVDAVPLITSVDTYFGGSLAWDSTGASAAQDITVVVTSSNTGSTHLQFVVDSLDLTVAVPSPTALPAGLALLGLAAFRRRMK